MEFEDFKEWMAGWLTESEEFDTFSGRSHFEAQYDEGDDSVVVTPRRRMEQGLIGYRLDHAALMKIFERWDGASSMERYKPSHYQARNWHEAPDTVATPLIPVIISQWLKDTHTLYW